MPNLKGGSRFQPRYEDNDEEARRRSLARSRIMSSSSSDLVSSGNESDGDEERAVSPDVASKSGKGPVRQAATKAAAFIAAAVLEEEGGPPSPPPIANPRHEILEAGEACNICDLVFNSVEELERHREVHEYEGPASLRQYRCKECSKVFKYKKCVQNHITREHNISPSMYLIEFGNSVAPVSLEMLAGKWKPIPQSTEVKLYENKIERTEYEGEKSGGQEHFLIGEPQLATPSFSMADDLQPRDSLNARTCLLCNKVCTKPSDLSRHMMKHTGEQPFQCSVCIRRFKAKRSMQYHMRSVHGIMVELSPALVDKLTSTKKFMRTAHKDMEKMHEGGMALSENMSTDNSQSGLGQQEMDGDDDDNLPDERNFRMKPQVFIKTEPVDPDEMGELDDDRCAADNDKSSKERPFNDDSYDPATEDKITGVAVLQQTILTESSDAHPMYTDSINRGHLVGGFYDDDEGDDGDDDEEDDDEEEGESHVYSIASLKGPDGEKPTIVKYKVNSRSEEILVTRMVGANIDNGEKAYLYKCHFCAKVFLSLSKLQAHLSDHLRLSQKIFNCHICGEVFQLKSQLQIHCKEHAKSKRRKESFMKWGNQRHTRDDDYKMDDDDAEETGELPVKVKLEVESDCEDHNGSIPNQEEGLPRFFSPEELSQMASAPLSVAVDSENMPIQPGAEAQISPSTDSELLPPVEVSINGGRGYRCEYCEKIFDRLFSLNRHVRVHTGIKPCYCKICGKGFSEPRNLRHHVIRFHSDGSQRHLLRRSASRSNRRGRGRRWGGAARPLTGGIAKPIIGATRSSYLRKMAYLNAGVFSEYAKVEAKKPHSLPGVSHQEGDSNDDAQDRNENESDTMDVAGRNEPNSSNEGDVAKSPGSDKIMGNHPVDALAGLLASGRAGSPREYRDTVPKNKRSRVGSLLKSKSSKGRTLSPTFNTLSNLKMVPEMNFSAHSIKRERDCGRPTAREMPAISVVFRQTSGGNTSLLSPFQHSVTQPRKQKKCRGNNKYFSTYSPRLHQVEVPAGRAEACKPQVLPDGKLFYECSYCHKAFASVSDVNRHMDFHEDVRPYKCEFCNYCSRTNSQLKVHMMRHQGIKQYHCEMCNYCGVTQSDLKRHNRSQGHLIRSRFVCTVCGLGHVTRQQKADHMLSCHSISVAESNAESPEQSEKNDALASLRDAVHLQSKEDEQGDDSDEMDTSNDNIGEGNENDESMDNEKCESKNYDAASESGDLSDHSLTVSETSTNRSDTKSSAAVESETQRNGQSSTATENCDSAFSGKKKFSKVRRSGRNTNS